MRIRRTRLRWEAFLWSIALFLSLPAAAQEVAVHIQVDVPVAEIDGAVLLEGDPMPGYNEGGLATIGVMDRHGYETEIASSIAGSYGPMNLISGSYTPTYRLDFSTGGLPLNPEAQVEAEIAIATDGTMDLDIPERTFRFEFRLNSAPFPVTADNEAHFLLRDRRTGSEFLIGMASEGAADIRVLPGRYDVVYQYVSGDDIPRNEHAVVLSDLDLRSFRRPILVDVEAYTQMIIPTLNGESFPSSGYQSGRIQLNNFDTGDVVVFGRTHEGSSNRIMIPGRYDAVYSRTLGGEEVPRNSLAVVMTGIDFVPSGFPGLVTVDSVDVGMVEITPLMTLNGAAFPDSGYESARIFLVGSTGEEIQIALTSDPIHSGTNIVPGVYDVFYRRMLGGEEVPRNNNARIAQDVVLDASGTLPLNVESVEVGFEFLLDGETFPVGAYQLAEFFVVGEFEGDIDRVALNTAPSTPRLLIKGTYDVVYNRRLGFDVPTNTNTIIRSDVLLDSDQTLVVPIETRVVIADFTMNGSDFPEDPGQSGEFFMRDGKGGEIRLGESNTGESLSVKAIEGAYFIDYEWEVGDQVPSNSRSRVGYVAVPEPESSLCLALGIGLLGWFGRRLTPIAASKSGPIADLPPAHFSRLVRTASHTRYGRRFYRRQRSRAIGDTEDLVRDDMPNANGVGVCRNLRLEDGMRDSKQLYRRNRRLLGGLVFACLAFGMSGSASAQRTVPVEITREEPIAISGEWNAAGLLLPSMIVHDIIFYNSATNGPGPCQFSMSFRNPDFSSRTLRRFSLFTNQSVELHYEAGIDSDNLIFGTISSVGGASGCDRNYVAMGYAKPQ